MTAPQPPKHSSPQRLLKATAFASLLAAVILVAVVLPAEHGVDPTGIGNALGLTALNVGKDAGETPPAPKALDSGPSVLGEDDRSTAAVQETVTRSDVPFRSDTLSLTLQPGEGSEIKASMRQGDQFVFVWKTAGGKVNFDMHGERVDAGSAFTSYWKGTQQADAQGTFIAPFDGTHGWYWRNRGKQPVTVTVDVAGFYSALKRQD